MDRLKDDRQTDGCRDEQTDRYMTVRLTGGQTDG